MKSVPPALGGTNTNPTQQDWSLATEICYNACSKKMIELTKEMLHEGKRVMLVAKDNKHMDRLHSMLKDYGNEVYSKRRQHLFN